MGLCLDGVILDSRAVRSERSNLERKQVQYSRRVVQGTLAAKKYKNKQLYRHVAGLETGRLHVGPNKS